MRPRFFPLALIAVGVVLLLSNLDLVPLESVKALLETWWPLILVIAGFTMMFDRR